MLSLISATALGFESQAGHEAGAGTVSLGPMGSLDQPMPGLCAAREPCGQPGLAQTWWEDDLNDGLQGPVHLVDVKKKGSELQTNSRQLKRGNSLSLGKGAVFFAMLTCLIIRNSAATEIYSLNIISKTAVAAGL